MKVTGGGGVALNVVEAGDRYARPILFIHGYCQSTYTWRHQFESDLARDFRLVAFDLRGHGESEKPDTPAAYTDSRLWADDVAGVIEECALERPIVVGWSYAGLVICDYLRFYGSSRLSAIDFVDAVTLKGVDRARAFTGPRFLPLFPALFAADLATYEPAVETFVDLCSATPLDPATRRALIASNLLASPVAREAMQRGRKLDNDDVLAKLDIPVLVTQGGADAVVLPASAEHIASTIPSAQLSIYPDAGHASFADDPERFNRELRELSLR